MKLNLEISVSKGYLAKAIGVSFDQDYYFNPTIRHKTDTICQNYVQSHLSDVGAFYTESNLGRIKYYEPNQILIGGIQPNMILGMLLGAEFIANSSMDADISTSCLSGIDINNLPKPESLLENKFIKLFDEQIQDVKRSGKNPIPPFFWDSSGRAAIHGTMTTAQKFLGENIFLDMITNPTSIKQITDWVIDSYVVLVKHFAAITEIQITSVHVGECSSCMIGSQQFEEFVVPGLNKIGQIFGSVRLHSCGQSNHILQVCKDKVSKLSSLDLGGETSLLKVRQIFGRDFPVSVAPIAKDLSNPESNSLVCWLEKILEDNDGGNLTILCHLEPEYSLNNLRILYRRINGK